MATDPLLLLVALAFAPPLLYLAGLAWRHPGPSAGKALLGFAYGATMCLVVLGLLYGLLAVLFGDPVRPFQGLFAERVVNEEVGRDFIVVVLLAPITEEVAKGLGVFLLGWRLASGRDGVMLGAAVGLGFAAIETLLYLLAAFVDAGSTLSASTLMGVASLALIRSVSAAFIHPAATGITGWGIARARSQHRSALLGAAPYLLGAILLHGLYNFLAGFLVVDGFAPELADLGQMVNLLAAIALALVAWGFVKRGVTRPA